MLQGALIGAAVGLVYAVIKVIQNKKAQNKDKPSPPNDGG